MLNYFCFKIEYPPFYIKQVTPIPQIKMAAPNPYTSPVTVTIRRVQTQNPNWVGGEDPEVLVHRFSDLQEAYLFCVKEAGLEGESLEADAELELHGWNIIPFARVKQVLRNTESFEAFYTESEDGDYVSMSLSYNQE